MTHRIFRTYSTNKNDSSRQKNVDPHKKKTSSPAIYPEKRLSPSKSTKPYNQGMFATSGNCLNSYNKGYLQGNYVSSTSNAYLSQPKVAMTKTKESGRTSKKSISGLCKQ